MRSRIAPSPYATAVSEPMSHAVAATLETLIDPGHRARLSPYVEAAQYQVLFGEAPLPERHVESGRAILARNAHVVDSLAESWKRFVATGRRFDPAAYAGDGFAALYLTTYFSVNVPKMQRILLDLARIGGIPRDLRVLDIGVGPGTTAVAVLDFLLAWDEACRLHGEPFPVATCEITGVDSQQPMLEMARAVVTAYGDALERRLDHQNRPAESPSRAVDTTIAAARTTTWVTHDLSRAPLPSPDGPGYGLVVAANILNELDEHSRRHLEQTLVEATADAGVVVVLEPGSARDAGCLMTWRRSLLRATPGFTNLGPCGQEFGAELPDACTGCWSANRRAFHQTDLYRAFCKSTALTDRLDEDNELLSWSHVVLQRAPARPDPDVRPREVSPGHPLDEPLRTRYLGRYREAHLVSDHPDAIVRGDVKDYLKLCPAHVTLPGEPTGICHRIAIERPTGYQPPGLAFGAEVKVSDLTPSLLRNYQRPGSLSLAAQAGVDGVSYVRPTDSTPDRDLAFLAGISPDTTQAIDDLAYRLFGFSAMRPFQHRIIGQALQGRSILGIAATGGGKSECYILPAMLLPGITIVVSPLKSLMSDQFEQRLRRRYGLDHLCTYLNGDVQFTERQARLRRLELGYYKLIYMTPEQLERPYVLNALKRADARVGVRYLALDEAHCISQWGHDFRPSYLNLYHRLRTAGIEPVRIALTATASPYVRADICDELDLDNRPLSEGGEVDIDSSNRPELDLVVSVLPDDNDKAAAIVGRLNALLDDNTAATEPGSAIVFMPWADHGDHDGPGLASPYVTQFAHALEPEIGQKVSIYYSDLDEDQAEYAFADGTSTDKPLGDLSGRTRETEQEAFITGERAIMVATKGFGMGIDKPNIRLVMHRTPPANLEAYAQEAGRAGRDGRRATAVLTYAAPRPVSKPAEHDKSDYAIQTFFLANNNIRRSDVVLLQQFLTSVAGDQDRVYVTSDQIMDYFDRAAADGRFTWPEFDARQKRHTEFPDHKAVLDTGHAYKGKTDYLRRIFGALDRVRPHVGGGLRVTLFDAVEQAGAVFPKLYAVDHRVIVSSNTSLGIALRAHGVDAVQLQELLTGPTLIPLAHHLGMSIAELGHALYDVKMLDGDWITSKDRVKPWWRSTVLGYAFLRSPHWGPADGIVDGEEWLAYAGAWDRVSKPQAVVNARVGGRSNPVLLDWFPSRMHNQPIAWEITRGPASLDASVFDAWVDAFMRIHDERKANDRAAYGRLLTDYLGVHDPGVRTDAGSPQPKCLRAVMLGYLDTGEVVQDNCLSCSTCVPSLDFSNSLEERRRRVLKISAEITNALADLGRATTRLPDPALVDLLFAEVRNAIARGERMDAYLAGWTGKTLDESPDHIGAAWIRAHAMSGGVIADQPAERADLCMKLATRVPDVDLPALRAYVHRFANELPPSPTMFRAQAEIARRMGTERDEVDAVSALLEIAATRQVMETSATIAYADRLADLSAADGPAPRPSSHELAQMTRAFCSGTFDEARTRFEPLLRGATDGAYRSVLARALAWPERRALLVAALVITRDATPR
jgi:superfamily II DNA helicase RecQ